MKRIFFVGAAAALLSGCGLVKPSCYEADIVVYGGTSAGVAAAAVGG